MISCDQHDYVEIACMYHYPIQLTLKSGHIVEGIAVDTVRNEQRDECIKIESKNNVQLVVLSELESLEVCIENPHFQHVVF